MDDARDMADYGLTLKDAADFPEIGAASLQPHLSPFDDTEFIIISATFIAPVARACCCAKREGVPPPPQAEEASQWERGRATAADGPTAKGISGNSPSRPPPPLREVFAGEAMRDAYQHHKAEGVVVGCNGPLSRNFTRRPPARSQAKPSGAQDIRQIVASIYETIWLPFQLFLRADAASERV